MSIASFSLTYYQEVVVTPLTRYQGPLSSGSTLLLKDETQQVGKSFKFRGTFQRLSEEKPGTTVVTASTGNHGMGVAIAAQKLGLHVHVFVPEHISTVKAQTLTELGARVVKMKGGYDECVQEALRFEKEHGAPYISSLEDLSVIRGHSSLFHELREQSKLDLDALFLPVGGGGLLAGCLDCYQGSDLRIVGVELDCVPSMKIALETKERVLLPFASSCAEGMLVRQAGRLPLKMAQEYKNLEIELVSEMEVKQAVASLWHYNRIRAEGAGASAIAAAIRYLERYSGQKIVAVVSGGNIDENTFQTIVS